MLRNVSLRVVTVFVLIIIGVIYALPNLYTTIPALQITQKSAQVIPNTLVATIKSTMDQAHIPYLPITRDDGGRSLWLRFKATDTQLKARDLLKSQLADGYSLVPSLKATTPKWLQAIGAEPMKLGLDLRGGIHFLLYVDIHAMFQQRLKGDIRALGTGLRLQDVRYSEISPYTDTETGVVGVQLVFRDAKSQAAAEAYVSKHNPDYVFSNADTDGSFTLRGVLTPVTQRKISEDTMQQNMAILTKRVNALGISEATITQQGSDHISVDLPGIQDPARAAGLIGKVATLNFQLVDTQHDAQTVANTGAVPFGSQLYQSEGQPILLKDQVILTGSNIISASSGVDETGRPSVNVRLGSGEVLFHEITGKNVGKQMAVVYIESQSQTKLVNGKQVTTLKQVPKIISVAVIQSALPNTFQITGLDSQRYAQNLALQLRSGAYVAPIQIVQNVLVGSTMGQSNIDKGVLSTLIGFIAVIIFMACYYRVFGLIASIALLLNVIFIIAVLSILSATLTLAGIAGIVLTMGMAVDANVLINERIREELRRGMSPLASIKAGYDRAFATIVDANVTTLIVAVILFALSDTSVKSFAVNLIIGLITSMITAIFFTRTFVNFIYGRRQVKLLSIGIRLPKSSNKKNQVV